MYKQTVHLQIKYLSLYSNCSKWIKNVIIVIIILTIRSQTTNWTFMLHLRKVSLSIYKNSLMRRRRLYVPVKTSTFMLFCVKHEPSSTDISKYFYKKNNNKTNWTYFPYADWPVSSLCETKILKCFALVWHCFDNTHVKTCDSFFLSKSTERVLMVLDFVTVNTYRLYIYIWYELLTDSQFDWNTVDTP